MTDHRDPDPVRVRIAPSPTGLLHFGTARTALFNWLFAHHMGGVFVLRIEDTDTERSTKAFEQDIIDGLQWLGITWEEGPDIGGPYGPYRQSERSHLYKERLEQLLNADAAYHCFCTKEQLEADRSEMMAKGVAPVYVGRCSKLSKEAQLARVSAGESSVIRLRVSEGPIGFDDIIRGNIAIHSDLIGDIVIARSVDAPLFAFAGVVDDHLMRISHVIRGEDHISNTPKQIAIQRALGIPTPRYAHLPLILSPDRTKLSKRYIETSLNDYRTKGYVPDAMVNFMAFIGWHPKEDREVMSRDELVAEFELERVQKGGGIFNTEKLDWLNAQHIKQLSIDTLADMLKPLAPAEWFEDDEARFRRAVEVERDRLKTLVDFKESASFFFVLPDYPAELLRWKEATFGETKSVLSEALQVLVAADEGIFSAPERLSEAFSLLLEEKGKGSVLWPLRVALSGKKASPGPFDIMAVLGRGESIQRVEAAIGRISASIN